MPDDARSLDLVNQSFSVGRTDEGEAVLSNGVSGEAALSICIPCYRDSANPLLTRLAQLPGAERTTLVVFDDGSADEALTRRLAEHIKSFPGPARLVTSPRNKGRAHARNRLLALAEAEWVLFLDADMLPDKDNFLSRYIAALQAADGPTLIAGGFTLWQVTPTRETALHAAQSIASECLPAAERAREPGRYVFTSNILCHTEILKSVRFDDEFTGWGWEDVDWGLRVAEQYPVRHIDNSATHLGLDKTNVLLEKFGGSGANFARLARRHPGAVRTMTLWRMARRLKKVPFQGTSIILARWIARRNRMPMKLRLIGLKLYRALCYAEHIE